MKCTIVGGDDLDRERIDWIMECGRKTMREYMERYPDSHIDEIRMVVRSR